MRRLGFAGFILCWFVTPANGQLQFIDPDAAKGTSAAVIVPDTAPLYHTAQFMPTGGGEEGQQIEELLKRVKFLALSYPSGKGTIVKLNFVVTRDDLVGKVEQALARHFPDPAKPAVSFVTGKRPTSKALLVVDAVIAVPSTGAPVIVPSQSMGDGAVLPAGARVWISGQAEKGVDLAEATRKTMGSLRDSLKFLGLKDDSVVQIKAFLQPMAEWKDAYREIQKSIAARPPIIFIEWKSSLPIEIELIAWAGRDREGVPIEFLTPPNMKASPVYSRITRVNYGKLIYVSGLHAAKGEGPADEIPEIFDQLGGILKKAGSDYRHLAKATYYVTNAEAVKQMGAIRPRYYDPQRPPAASLAMTEGVGRAGKTVTLDMIAVPSPTVNINEYGPPEYGHGLKEKDALEGWISLFDGTTTFGWTDAKVDKGRLQSGETLSRFGPALLIADVVEPGQLMVGNQLVNLTRGSCTAVVAPPKPETVRLAGGAVVRSLTLQPLKMQELFNGKDLTGWKRIDRAKTPPDRLAKWTVENGAIHAVGGPSCLEYQERKFGDLIWQVEARMNVRQANGGLFFRAIPGDFMNGYEAQLYNRCMDGDPGKPAVWATGAIDDRQNARRLMSRDGHWFVQTVIAHGPHIATWINGHQTVDWTDTRATHANPRQGRRVEPGVLQLQAHDVGTDLEFRKVSARALE